MTSAVLSDHLSNNANGKTMSRSISLASEAEVERHMIKSNSTSYANINNNYGNNDTINYNYSNGNHSYYYNGTNGSIDGLLPCEEIEEEELNRLYVDVYLEDPNSEPFQIDIQPHLTLLDVKNIAQEARIAIFF
jgi:hypothetical protein